ncbi:MAG: phosphoribosylanthranilate isomerase [Synechococcaceae cyanobacterium]|nr:phosphoribosylanthranilate isomerase [Synechococcaceae cyanobacterium]
MTQLKICGLRHPEQARAVAALGVDAIGVIAVPGSPRHLDAALRPALFAAIEAERPACRRVLVVADPSDDDLPALLPKWGHTVLQLHGQETPERCAVLRERLGLPVWKALRVREPAQLEGCAAWLGVVDALLLDAWVPGSLGGTGQPIPPHWLASFAPPVPWWLAGGVTPERVPDLLARLRPTGLDASSGVEDAPGEKNLARIAGLLAAVREAAGSGTP